MAKPGRKPSPPSAGGKPIYEQKKELRDITARMEDLRRTLAIGGDELRATRAAIKGANEELRNLRFSIGERQKSLVGLRATLQAAHREREGLDVRRERLRTLLDLTPEPDDDAS